MAPTPIAKDWPRQRVRVAYLSTQAAGGQPAVNARDRIGTGPWQNIQGVVIAADVATLHGEPI